MATTTVCPTARTPMTFLAAGFAGAAVATATGTAGATTSGDHAVTIAVITLFGGLLVALVTAVLAPLLLGRMRGRDDRADLNNRLIDQLDERNAEIVRLHDDAARLLAENAELRRQAAKRPR